MPDPEEEAEEEDEDDETGLQLAWSLLRGFLAVFLAYGSPIVVLVLLALALKAQEPARPLIVAGVLTALSFVTWMNLPADRDSDRDSNEDGNGGAA